MLGQSGPGSNSNEQVLHPRKKTLELEPYHQKQFSTISRTFFMGYLTPQQRGIQSAYCKPCQQSEFIIWNLYANLTTIIRAEVVLFKNAN